VFITLQIDDSEDHAPHGGALDNIVKEGVDLEMTEE
jgi:hypothetical protein